MVGEITELLMPLERIGLYVLFIFKVARPIGNSEIISQMHNTQQFSVQPPSSARESSTDMKIMQFFGFCLKPDSFPSQRLFTVNTDTVTGSVSRTHVYMHTLFMFYFMQKCRLSPIHGFGFHRLLNAYDITA